MRALALALAVVSSAAVAQSITIQGSVTDAIGESQSYSVTATQVSGNIYYVASVGSDSNNGTSKATPWLHAPGMTGCSATCSSTTPKPGDQVIFRGGDSWHTSAGGTIGIPWTWTWSGQSGTPIYIGVDNTWFSGSSWQRPAIDMDNPLSTGQPTRCSFDDTNITAISLRSVNYVTFDNFEFRGKCWSGSPNGASLQYNGTHITISNSYFHGWTMTSNVVDDTHHMVLGSGNGVTNNVIAGNVFDGSDSSFGTTAGKASGFAIYAECYDVHNNVFSHVSNGAVCSNLTYVHDNLFQFMYEPVTGVHGNVVESLGGIQGGHVYFYNNFVHDINEGVTIWPQASAFYSYNNVFYNIGNATNCMMQNPPGFSSGAGAATSYIYNNTFESPCNIRFDAANSTTPSWSGPVYFANNHFIDFVNLNGATDCFTTSGCSVNDSGGNVFQSASDATSQGYIPANGFAPGSSNGATYGAGVNLTSSCPTMPGLCTTTTLGVSEAPGNVVVTVPVSPRPASGPWNAGAH